MKKLLVALLVLTLFLGTGTGLAENVITLDQAGQRQEQTQGAGEGEAETAAPDPTPTPKPAYDEFVIGATTRLSGMFFTNMWGNNTADIDVRTLIHGYSPVVWTAQSLFEFNQQVVHGVQVGAYAEDGNKVYMIPLHDDLKYNDGTPIGSADYGFSLRLLASPVIHELGGITTKYSHIEGYDAYVQGETEVFAGLRIVDDLTFTVEIKAEYLPFVYELGMLAAIPYPISVIAPGC